jgi:hypothetical protein
MLLYCARNVSRFFLMCASRYQSARGEDEDVDTTIPDGGDATEVAALVRQLIPLLFAKMLSSSDRIRYHSLALLDTLVKQVCVLAQVLARW